MAIERIGPRWPRRRAWSGAVDARLAAERRLSVRALFERWAAIDLNPRVAADGRRLGRKDGGAFTRAQFERRIFPSLGDVAAEDVKRGDLLSFSTR